ncbi:MAG: hypothetical protein EHM84_07155, partial [Lysobacterales bacterium]
MMNVRGCPPPAAARHARRAVVGAVVLLFAPFIGAIADNARGVKTPPFERVQLPNCAVLLLMERHDVPIVAFNAMLRGGAVTDP